MHILLEFTYNIIDICPLFALHMLRCIEWKMCKKVLQRHHFVRMREFIDYIVLTFATCDHNTSDSICVGITT